MFLFRVLILWRWGSSTRWATGKLRSHLPSHCSSILPPASIPSHAGTCRELKHFKHPEDSAQGAGKQNQTLGWFLLTWPKSDIYHKEFKAGKVTAAWLTGHLAAHPGSLCTNGESPRTLLLSQISSETFVWQDGNHSPRAGRGWTCSHLCDTNEPERFCDFPLSLPRSGAALKSKYHGIDVPILWGLLKN